MPLTVHLVLRDSETAVMDAADVETSFGELCEKWRLANQNEMRSLREHDVCQEVTEEKRWTVPSTSIIPESVFTIRNKSTKKNQIIGGGNFQDYAGMTVMTVRVLMLIDCLCCWVVCDWCAWTNCPLTRITGQSRG